jgi:hypothetical protein
MRYIRGKVIAKVRTNCLDAGDYSEHITVYTIMRKSYNKTIFVVSIKLLVIMIILLDFSRCILNSAAG